MYFTFVLLVNLTTITLAILTTEEQSIGIFLFNKLLSNYSSFLTQIFKFVLKFVIVSNTSTAPRPL